MVLMVGNWDAYHIASEFNWVAHDFAKLVGSGFSLLWLDDSVF